MEQVSERLAQFGFTDQRDLDLIREDVRFTLAFGACLHRAGAAPLKAAFARGSANVFLLCRAGESPGVFAGARRILNCFRRSVPWRSKSSVSRTRLP